MGLLEVTIGVVVIGVLVIVLAAVGLIFLRAIRGAGEESRHGCRWIRHTSRVQRALTSLLSFWGGQYRGWGWVQERGGWDDKAQTILKLGTGMVYNRQVHNTGRSLRGPLFTHTAAL